jgi:hypothetical protein
MTNPVAIYQIKRTFRAPLNFAYKWCTDFTEGDRKLQGEKGFRQILRKTGHGAVYEDLTPTPGGWMWSRQTVSFHPPNEWRAVADGNYRTWNLVYTLRELPDGRTEFVLTGRRRATSLGVKNPPKAELEQELNTMWRNLGTAMEKDYRKRHSGKSR